LNLTAAVYRLERGNVAVPDPVEPSRFLLVDAQRTEGVEIAITGRLTRSWTVTGGYARQEGEITRSISTAAPAGARLAHLPAHSASLWNRFEIDRRWGLGLGVLHRSEVYASTANLVTLPRYSRLLRLRQQRHQHHSRLAARLPGGAHHALLVAPALRPTEVVRRGNDVGATLDRMRKRLGLVLSGGGSRGLVHAGVIRALVEAGFAPDAIAGSSSGALVGALYAAGYDYQQTLAFFDDTNPFRFSRLALRKPGFFDSEKILLDLKRWFPDDSFAALRCRLFVAATELVAGRIEIFSSGPLIWPLLASASVPLVFTPTPQTGKLFVDGGVLDNFPVEPLAGGCELILGVYASPLREVAVGSFGNSLAVTQRALEISRFDAARRKFPQAAMVICPPELGRYGTFDIKRHPEIAEIGYRAACLRMPEIRRLWDAVP
jgi:NTE family protein